MMSNEVKIFNIATDIANACYGNVHIKRAYRNTILRLVALGIDMSQNEKDKRLSEKIRKIALDN